MKPNKLIFSALPYVNNIPHLGNIIGCVLSSDVYSRFCRKKGYKTLHICGTDEYGTACEMAAIKAKTTPKEICDTNYKKHKEIYDWFGIEFDYFGRTTDGYHAEKTTEMFLKIYENGFFEEKDVDQYFCEKCAIFLADRYVIGDCPLCKMAGATGDQCDSCGGVYVPSELLNAKCEICGTNSCLKATKHIFLKLSALKEKIETFVVERSGGWTENAAKISLDWTRKELRSRCITRDLKYRWGVPVPIPGFEEKVLYVWFDAPIGYLSFLDACIGEKTWQFVKNAEIFQFMGKDNVSFHSIFFPGMLFAAGMEDFLVHKIAATEYLTFEGKKFSKSKQHGIFGDALLENKQGTSSIWRYYLMKIRPESKDSNFAMNEFKLVVNGELVHNLGNFVNRSLKYIRSKLDCKLKFIKDETKQEYQETSKIIADINALYADFLLKMENTELKNGLKNIMEISSLGNEFVQRGIGRPLDISGHYFSVGVSIVKLIGYLVDPFMPEISRRIFEMLNLENGNYPDCFELIEDGHVISNDIKALFNLIE